MSIILLLAAAMGATGGAPAPAGAGPSLVQVGSWDRGGRGPAFGRGRPFRPGPGRHHRRHRGFGGPAFNPWGGIDGPFEAVDPHGNGFFAGAGGRIRSQGGRPYYDYDRAYPYEWASAAAGGSLEWQVEEIVGASAERCTTEKSVRVCRGGR